MFADFKNDLFLLDTVLCLSIVTTQLTTSCYDPYPEPNVRTTHCNQFLK